MSPKKKTTKATKKKTKKLNSTEAEDAKKFALEEKEEQEVAEVPEESTEVKEKETELAEESQETKKKTKKSKKTAQKEKKDTASRLRFWWTAKKKKQADEPDAAEEADLPPAQVELRVREIKRPSGISAMFKQINYIGMGKFRHSFIQSLALMLNAGLSLVEALQAIEAEMRSRAVKKLINEITVSVQSGMPLWRSMENTFFFTPYEIALVHIGEDAGNLAKNLSYLAEQQEKDQSLRQKVKMAMIYPTIVLVMVFVIIMGLGMFVLPNLVQVLFSMKVELPLSTRIVIKITKFFEDHGTLILPSSIGLFVTVALLTKFTKFKIITQWCIFKIPGIGRLAREATIARFGVILGGLLRAGVPLIEALESLVDVTQLASYKNFYKKLLTHINIGDSFSKSFVAIKSTKRMLPVSVQQLVVTGERSGTLSQTLLKISDIYEKKAEDTAEKLPVILEPLLLLLIGAIVGGIAFSIITPIYSVVGNVGAG